MSTTAQQASAPRPPGRGETLDVVVARAGDLRRALAPLGARSISVFGSVARRSERPDSDVDLLVDLEADVGLFALLRMQGIAQEILGMSVDLVPRADVKADIAKSIAKDEIRL
ncbi:nucleotidyltransferase family protein [Leucobacter massiliensis]|uniref:Polymerase nucleotidyl transferase domain-containing protein n=1 Tax=Leucobacter massiliensis TaxID=1686285 RepID=A0A2S9QSS8_9MICO|nr:nucleotidyltransferase domain-containing protein [Leucobacter massiliensis]PRI12650.1 hypothetical protein B4915_00195 [Leucobacter massiliensis]